MVAIGYTAQNEPYDSTNTEVITAAVAGVLTNFVVLVAMILWDVAVDAIRERRR
jgi:hypothetical protein